MGVNLRHLLIFITLSGELTRGYECLRILSTFLLHEMTELQRVEQLRMSLQLRTAIGRTGDEHACNRTGAVQTKGLRDKTVDLVSDLKISTDGR